MTSNLEPPSGLAAAQRTPSLREMTTEDAKKALASLNSVDPPPQTTGQASGEKKQKKRKPKARRQSVDPEGSSSNFTYRGFEETPTPAANDNPEASKKERKKKPRPQSEKDGKTGKPRRRSSKPVAAPDAGTNNPDKPKEHRPRKKKPTDDANAAAPSDEDQNTNGVAKPKHRRSSRKKPTEGTPPEDSKVAAEKPKRPKSMRRPSVDPPESPRKSKKRVQKPGSVEQELMALVQENQKKKAESQQALGVGVALPPIEEQADNNPVQTQQQQGPMPVQEATVEDSKDVFQLGTTTAQENSVLLTPVEAPRTSMGASASSLQAASLDNNTSRPPTQQEGVPFVALLTEKTKKRQAAKEAARAAPVDLWSDDSPAEGPVPMATDALLLVQDPPVQDHLELVDRHHAKEKGKERQLRMKKAALVVIAFLVVVGIYLIVHTLVFGWGESSPASTPTVAPTLSPDFAIPAGLSEQTKQAIRTDPTSPQSRAYTWLSQDPQRNAYPEWRLLQRFAVATMVLSLRKPSDPIYSDSDPWLAYDQSECDWGGTMTTDFDLPRCNDNGRVLNLELSSVSGLQDGVLVTSIPAEVAMLDQLERLGISQNGVFVSWGGLLPPEMEQLASKFRILDVSQNQLHDPMQASSPLFRLSSLEQLDASQNFITGSIPTELAALQGLNKLDLSSNRFTGSMPFEFSVLNQMKHLDLSDNSLTGQFDLFFMTGLEYLDVGTNFLTGKLPLDLAQDMTSLRILRFDGNFLAGPIATEVGLLTQLVELDLSSTEVTGTIPSEVGLLTNLEVLKLSKSQLHGDVPTQLSNLPSLRQLELHETEISGMLPPNLCGPSLTSVSVNCDKVQCSGSLCDCDCQ